MVLQQSVNSGKAEAVRQGMNYAFDQHLPYAGFWDADLATPLTAIAPFLDFLESRPELDMIFGVRVRLLGRQIERHASRHYIGPAFLQPPLRWSLRSRSMTRNAARSCSDVRRKCTRCSRNRF